MENFLLQTIEKVKEVGEIAKQNFTHSEIVLNKGNDDIVTNIDLKIEQLIFEYVQDNFPEHGFDSEERNIFQPDAEYMWVLDPIDGTKYYSQGVPLYSISLALMHKNETIQGIVLIPESNELYYASKFLDSGAKKNDESISCSKSKSIDDFSVVIELPNRNDSTISIDKSIKILQILIKKTKRIRILGVGSLSICYCASGGFDLYINLGSFIKHYDYLAAKFILEKSGGIFVSTDGLILGGQQEKITQILEYLNKCYLINNIS